MAGTDTPAKKNVPEKWSKIISAAISVFAEQGFYNSTVADVAGRAQVADGTIYLYFKNKDDLLISIFEHSMDIFISAALAEMKGLLSARDQLSKFIELHLKLVEKYPELAQVIQIELRQSSKFMKEYANEKFFEYLGILEGIIQLGQSKGVFKKNLDPVLMKRAIFGAIDEMALEWVLMKRKRYSVEEAAKQVTELFVGGLGVA